MTMKLKFHMSSVIRLGLKKNKSYSGELLTQVRKKFFSKYGKLTIVENYAPHNARRRRGTKLVDSRIITVKYSFQDANSSKWD